VNCKNQLKTYPEKDVTNFKHYQSQMILSKLDQVTIKPWETIENISRKDVTNSEY
jgi:hypothetical protein